ncbi:MAG: insulinase family protein, partial [Planctomycetota bacterium]
GNTGRNARIGKWWLAALVVAVVASGGQVHAEEGTLKPIRTVEGITEYRLPNGLQVLLFPDPSKPTVTVNLTVFVGSRHEGYGEAGMAHLLEHMLFKGTPTHPDIPRLLQERGARFNGTTWLDRTNYYETLPASEENLVFAIRLEADRMVNSPIRAEDLASEMTVVRNEFERGENDPIRVLLQRVQSVAYDWHNYGRPTIGNRADIERVPVERLRRFYKKYYQPNNAALIVAGRFEPAVALNAITKYFGAIPRPPREIEQTYTEEPPQDGERTVTLRRVGEVGAAALLFHIPAGPHPDFVPVDLLTTALTLAPSGRLYKALVETKKASTVYGSAMPLHDPGIVRFLAVGTPGTDPAELRDIMIGVLEEVANEGVTSEELERARRRLQKQIELAADDTQQTAIELSEWAAQGDWRLKFLYRDRVESATGDDVHRVARAYLRESNRTVGLFIPTEAPSRTPIPPTPDLAKMIGDYRGREVAAAGEAFDVSAENVERRTQWGTLSTGLQTALLPKKTRGEAVVVRLTLRFGSLETLKGLKTACEFLGPMMVRGTKHRDRQQIQDALDENRAVWSASSEPGKVTFEIETKRPHLKAVLQLLEEVLREPSFPESELEVLRQQQLTAIEQARTEPQALALRTLRRKFRPYEPDDPRYEPTLDEEYERVKALRREDLVRLHAEFLNGNHGQLAVVGDFEPDEVRAVFEQICAGWSSEHPVQHIPQRGDFDIEAEYIEIKTPDKANAWYFAGQLLPMRDTHPDYPELILGNFVLGSGALSSRLGNRVRQKEGLSYGVFSHFFASPTDDRASLTIMASFKPENKDRLRAAIREELQKLLEHGVTEAELESARKGYLQQIHVARTSDSRLAAELSRLLYAGRTMRFVAEFEKQLSEASVEAVNAALKRHFTLKKLVEVTAGDF